MFAVGSVFFSNISIVSSYSFPNCKVSADKSAHSLMEGTLLCDKSFFSCYFQNSLFVLYFSQFHVTWCSHIWDYSEFFDRQFRDLHFFRVSYWTLLVSFIGVMFLILCGYCILALIFRHLSKYSLFPVFISFLWQGKTITSCLSLKFWMGQLVASVGMWGLLSKSLFE